MGSAGQTIKLLGMLISKASQDSKIMPIWLYINLAVLPGLHCLLLAPTTIKLFSLLSLFFNLLLQDFILLTILSLLEKLLLSILIQTLLLLALMLTACLLMFLLLCLSVILCCDLLFHDSDLISHNECKLSHEQFCKILNFDVKDTHFIFSKQLYNQIDGFTMGSSLGPSLANIVMCTLEQVS